ncbi:MAG: hypothetical protein CL610_21865 [Anaerolineaceae bacterium]|nr:hypothetical protein [Anaerolineaceae bacterium]
MNKSFNLIVHVDEKRRVVIDLPEDIPTGPLELEVMVHLPAESVLTRDTVRDRLSSAGLIDPSGPYVPAEAQELSAEERLRIGRALAGDKTVQQLIDEEREERS